MQTGPERPATQEVVANPNLELKLYGTSARSNELLVKR